MHTKNAPNYWSQKRAFFHTWIIIKWQEITTFSLSYNKLEILNMAFTHQWLKIMKMHVHRTCKMVHISDFFAQLTRQCQHTKRMNELNDNTTKINQLYNVHLHSHFPNYIITIFIHCTFPEIMKYTSNNSQQELGRGKSAWFLTHRSETGCHVKSSVPIRQNSPNKIRAITGAIDTWIDWFRWLWAQRGRGKIQSRYTSFKKALKTQLYPK